MPKNPPPAGQPDRDADNVGATGTAGFADGATADIEAKAAPRLLTGGVGVGNAVAAAAVLV